MENTDFVIEHIDEEVQVIADQPSVVTNYPANTDFFIENIDSNVISIAHSLNIEASEVDFRPANTDFFIENIDKNVIAIAESMSLTPSEVDFRPANTDFFVENIDKNLIEIAESLSLTPYEVTIRPANTDMFIENIDKNVTLIKGSTNVVTVSGEYININIPDGGKVQSAEIEGNATQADTPTPDSPQPISVVTGENVVKVVGKNLLDIPTGTHTSSAVTWTITDSTISASGTANSTWTEVVARQDFSAPIPAGIYTFSIPQALTKRLQLVLYEADGTTHDLNLYENTTSASITTTYTSTQFRLVYRAESASVNISIPNQLQLELGSTATAYESYTAQDYEVNLGKNLWGGFLSDYFRSGGGVDFVNYADGSISAEGTRTGESTSLYASDAQNSGRIRTFQSGTYTLSGGSSLVQLEFRTVGGSTTGYRTSTSTGDITFTLPENTNAYIRAIVPSNSTVDETLYPQLELGSQATSYSEYFTPLELAKIGTYQDRIYKDGEKWYVEKQTGKVVLDGSETWVGGGTFGNYWRSSIPIADIKPIASNADFVGLSDHFHKDLGVFSTAMIQEGMFCQFRGDKRVYFACPISVQSASDWTTWLASNPTTIYYALATPTTTEITNQSLIDQLEALASASLNQGVNNIFTEIATGNAMPTLKLVIEKY